MPLNNLPEIIEVKKISEGKFIRFLITKYIDSSGTVREWESLERVNCYGIVAIVPVTENKEVLLIQQFRPPVNGFVIEFPAGLTEKDEPLEDTARRELREETGYSAQEMIFLTEGTLSSGASGEILSVFLAKGLQFEGIGNRDETEDIDVLKIPIDDLDDKLSKLRTQGFLIDLKIYGLVALARKFLP